MWLRHEINQRVNPVAISQTRQATSIGTGFAAEDESREQIDAIEMLHGLGLFGIRGGRANVRQALYMPARVAARFNPDLKTKYQQLIATGKPAKIAITAVMPKLVVTANALLKADRLWTPSLAPPSRIL